MDLILVLIAAILMLLGLIGSFLPVIPGPLSSWAGFLTLYFSKSVELSKTFLLITFLVAFLIWILDYIIPALGTKHFGGSKYGMIGTSIGLVVGLLAPIPGGIIIGPFIGALIGELYHKNDTKIALKAAFGSFIGFLGSTLIKFITCVAYLIMFIGIIWNSRELVFSF
ncbi:DUF456 domain-containing protein [Gaetbulibacter saemankumensis]|uniref:DUF456 domain-containing protein n=1 Tax=Gaetbulibacter saemankumensis TaxID=311208 RepID=UPI00042468F9|nr:DUF456 domain-containing protein [Gaetbulibacter saemankumensis]